MRPCVKRRRSCRRSEFASTSKGRAGKGAEEALQKAALAEKEWGFRSCPEGELSACWTYEYAREIPELVSSVEAWRNAASSRNFESFLKLPGRPSACNPFDVFLFFPEWPRAPYLSISNNVREKRRQRIYGKANAWTVLRPSLWKSFDWMALTDHLRREDQEGRMPLFHRVSPDTATLALIQIDWNFPSTAIIEQFHSFLETHRPPGQTPQKRKVGQGSPVRKWASELKALGAYRLREKYHLSIADIVMLTREKCGKALYSDESAVSKAVKRAKARIDAFKQNALFFETRVR
jgi:hypothetical protein